MKQVAILVFCILVTANVFAKDYGQVGPVYPIAEMSLLDYIYNKLTQMKKSGELEQMQKIFVDKVTKNADRPKAALLPQALRDNVRDFDPSITIKEDIKNEQNKIIAKAGTVVNPLKYINLSKELVFINADNKNEVLFAAKKLKENNLNKIILTSGSIKTTNLQLDYPVYFDQEARLVTKFDIKVTPSVISQDGLKLVIKEVAL